MKVNEVFPMVNGIMKSIADKTSYTFNDDVDLLLLSKCGRREVSPVVEMMYKDNDFINRLSTLIILEYKETWDKIYDTLTLEYNPLSASQYNETETRDDSVESNDNSVEVRKNDISTDDALPDNFISDGKTTNDSTSSSTSKNVVTRTLKRTSNGTSFKPVDLLKSEIEMRISNKFISRIVEDVKNYISMPIY